MNIPKITVFMPVFNTPETFLRESIESILRQSYSDFELLIINDGSKTLVKDVILSYHDDRIRYEENEINYGLPFTRNKGLKLARGDYLALMDSDDISMTDRLEKQVAFLDSHPDYGVYSGGYQYIGEKNSLEHNKDMDHEEIKILLTLEDCIANPTVMLRLSSIRNNNISYGNYTVAQDYDFFTKAIFYTKFFNSREIFLLYRCHEGNVSHQYKELQYTNAKQIRRLYVSKLYNISEKNASVLVDNFLVFKEFWPIIQDIWVKSGISDRGYIEKYYFHLIYESFMSSRKTEYITPDILLTYLHSTFYKKLGSRRKYKILLLYLLRCMGEWLNR